MAIINTIKDRTEDELTDWRIICKPTEYVMSTFSLRKKVLKREKRVAKMVKRQKSTYRYDWKPYKKEL